MTPRNNTATDSPLLAHYFILRFQFQIDCHEEEVLVSWLVRYREKEGDAIRHQHRSFNFQWKSDRQNESAESQSRRWRGIFFFLSLSLSLSLFLSLSLSLSLYIYKYIAVKFLSTTGFYSLRSFSLRRRSLILMSSSGLFPSVDSR